MSDPKWVKASASAANGNCVEMADVEGGVLIRDSKDPAGEFPDGTPALHISAEGFRIFRQDAQAGRYDFGLV